MCLRFKTLFILVIFSIQFNFSSFFDFSKLDEVTQLLNNTYTLDWADDFSAKYLGDPFTNRTRIFKGLNSPIDFLNINKMQQYLVQAQQYIQDQYMHDRKLFPGGIILDPSATGYTFWKNNIANLTYRARYNHISSEIITKALDLMILNANFDSNVDRIKFVTNVRQQLYIVKGVCIDETVNTIDKRIGEEQWYAYRTIDGSYNNRLTEYTGKTGQPFRRILPPDYGDSCSTPRLAHSGKPLPNARKLSLEIFQMLQESSDQVLGLTALTMMELVTNDLALHRDDNVPGGLISCCYENEHCALLEPLQHSSCYPIEISDKDPWYSLFRIGCLNFVRSLATPTAVCHITERRQANFVTGWLDASWLYGSDNETSLKVRDDFLLLLTPEGNLYLDKNKETSEQEYILGDHRSNRNGFLETIHLAFIRQHNRIAKNLKLINDHWQAEKIFQETRRIVIAQYQHIVYTELLPAIMGAPFTDEVDIPNKLEEEASEDTDFYSIYDSSADGSCSADFAIASRIFHAAIPNDLNLINKHKEIMLNIKFTDILDNLTLGFNRPMNEYYANTMIYTQMGELNREYSTEVINKLFKGDNIYGLDLLAMDIQRGRDHGIPGYNAYRKECAYTDPVATLNGSLELFSPLQNTMTIENIIKMAELYEHPDDIELLVGGLFEEKETSSQLGRVMHCIFLKQFFWALHADRHFYTNYKPGETNHFPKDKLMEIKKTKLAGIFCQNDIETRMTRHAFFSESVNNFRVDCKQLRCLDYDINLNLWFDYPHMLSYINYKPPPLCGPKKKIN